MTVRIKYSVNKTLYFPLFLFFKLKKKINLKLNTRIILNDLDTIS